MAVTHETGGGHLVAALRAHGVDTVFGIPGTHNLPVYARLRSAGIRHVATRHEQGAGFAADGYARVSGRPGVAVVTTGPAVTNAATALAQAYSDSVPVLLVSPGVPSDHPWLGNGLLHEAKDQQRAMDALVAYSHRVASLAEIPEAVCRAFVEMTGGRPRPVHLEVPLDLLAAQGPAPPAVPVPMPPAEPAPEAVDAAAAALQSGRRVGLVLGGGARSAGVPALELARRLGAPVITTVNGKGTVDEADPMVLGAGLHLEAAHRFLTGCDAVLAVGTELAEADHWRRRLDLPGTVVRVDVDPSVVHSNVPAQVPLIGDAAACLRALLERVPSPPAPPDQGRAEEVRSAVRAEAAREAAPWDVLLAALRAGLPADGVVAGDSAMVCYLGAVTSLPVGEQGRFLYPTGFGTLGYGLPAAVGARIAAPERAVCVLMGDGGFQFTAPEIGTAVQLGLPIPIVVVDNGGYGEIKAEMQRAGIEPFAVDLPRVDLPALARAYGARGVEAGDPADLEQAVPEALGADRPTLIRVSLP